MPPTKTPTSSLSMTELLIKRVWYRSLPSTWRWCSMSTPHRTPVAHASSVAELPPEIIEMIIFHLIYDKSSLLACSLVCYSWYIAVVPHLHHTLITPTHPHSWRTPDKFMWPKPLRGMHKLGLLPLVQKFQIHMKDGIHDSQGFSPIQLNLWNLRHFVALTNVQDLGIDYLDIPSFMSRLRRHFGHFLPSVRSLALRAPKGSRRQIVYFIGLFQHLEDLKLLYDLGDSKVEPADNLTLIPSFAPPLRGRLVLEEFTRVGILRDMIDLFGGIRFRYMDLFRVDGTRLLLDACEETLETLQLRPVTLRGGELPLDSTRVIADNPTAASALRDFDLSRNKSLRTLEITARSVDNGLWGGPPITVASLFTYPLSTITSPVFSEVTVFYQDYDFCGVRYQDICSSTSRLFLPPSLDEEAEEALLHRRRFEVFRTMHKVRGFRLVLCIDGWDGAREYVVAKLKAAVAVEKARNGFDNIFLEPQVIHSPRGSRNLPGPRTPWTPL